MSRKWNRKKPPSGWDSIEATMDALDRELREAVNAPHEGKRKGVSQWPIHQINWQRSRYIYDLYYKYKRISKQLYQYCIRNKLVDAALIAKWKKPGYDRLCSAHVINTSNQNFGTTSICRVPKQQLRAGQIVEDRLTGCRGCCSGKGGYRNIFGNKFGQYLAAIQVAREESAIAQGEQHKQDKNNIFARDNEEVVDARQNSHQVAKQAKEINAEEAVAAQDWLGAETSKARQKRKKPDTSSTTEDDAKGEDIHSIKNSNNTEKTPNDDNDKGTAKKVSRVEEPSST